MTSSRGIMLASFFYGVCFCHFSEKANWKIGKNEDSGTSET
jgi:hypothetical protein